MNIDFTLWPNTNGNLGNIKVQIPDGVNTFWPEGDALVGNFVYKDGELTGFVDTKALTVNESKSSAINYDYVNIHLDSIKEGDIIFNRGERSKYFTVTYGSNAETFVIIDFNTTDQETIDTVRTAKRVVDNYLYDINNGLIGKCDTSKIEVGGNSENNDGLFRNIDPTTTTERGLVLSEFNSDMSSLRDGKSMFYGCTNLTSFTSDLSSLTTGNYMFYGCTNLTSFSSDLSSLENGSWMFRSCTNLTSFSSNLTSLTNGESMFEGCSKLTSFSSDLSSLTTGYNIFQSCKLDTASIQNIANTINTVNNEPFTIGIGNSTPNEQEETAFNTMVSKGWAVYVMLSGVHLEEWNPTALTPNDGEETSTPIPFYAKPVSATEETASYIDANGNYFIILGGHLIYGDDLSTYGMFTCEENAAINMGLTKIERKK